MAERWGVGLMGAIGAVAGGVSAAAASLLGGGDAFVGSIAIGAGGGAFIAAALFWAIRDQSDLLASGFSSAAPVPHPLPPASLPPAEATNLVPLVRALGDRFGELAERQLDALDRLVRQEPALQGEPALHDARRLARRSRRAAGTLIVLADPDGSAPARADHPIADVLDAALADSEHRSRIDVESVHGEVLRGEFVEDVAHLLAELIDNAAAASSEPVVVVGRRATDGYVLAVVDEGDGLSAVARADANHILTSPPGLDRQSPGALGLSVSGRLAARHGITVQLLEGATDGVIAKVRLPLRLLEGGTDVVPTPLERTLEALAAPGPDLLAEPVATTEDDVPAAPDGRGIIIDLTDELPVVLGSEADDPWPTALARSIDEAAGAAGPDAGAGLGEPGPEDETVAFDLTDEDGAPTGPDAAPERERAERTRQAALGGRPGNGVAHRRRR